MLVYPFEEPPTALSTEMFWPKDACVIDTCANSEEALASTINDNKRNLILVKIFIGLSNVFSFAKTSYYSVNQTISLKSKNLGIYTIPKNY